MSQISGAPGNITNENKKQDEESNDDDDVFYWCMPDDDSLSVANWADEDVDRVNIIKREHSTSQIMGRLLKNIHSQSSSCIFSFNYN